MYTIEIPVISLSENWRFKPLTTLQQKELCKVLFEEDNFILINNVINEILEQCVHSHYNIKKLNIIDKLIILIRLRSISIGSTLDLIIKKDNKKINLNYDFNEVLERVYFSYKNIHPIIIDVNNIKIKCFIPYIRWENEIVKKNLINYYINDIFIFNKSINFAELNIQDQDSIIENLPADLIYKLTNYIQDINTKISNIYLYKFLEDSLPLHITGDTIFEYIKFIFKEDLHNIYKDIYSLNVHLHFESNYIENLSPIERDMYINMFKRENTKTSNAMPTPQQEINSDPSLIDSLDMYKNIKGG